MKPTNDVTLSVQNIRLWLRGFSTGLLLITLFSTTVFGQELVVSEKIREDRLVKDSVANTTANSNSNDFFILIHSEVGLKYEFSRALISRENTQVATGESDPRTHWVKELNYVKNKVILEPQVAVNLWQILDVFLEWPLVIWSEETLSFAQGTTQSNSTIARDMENIPYVKQWQEEGMYVGNPAKNYNDWAFDLNRSGAYSRKRAGFRYPKIGLGFTILNQKKMKILPTLKVKLQYQMAKIGFLSLPVMMSNEDNSEIGAVAQASHRFTTSLFISKQIEMVTPFFNLSYTLPLASDGAPLGYEPRHQAEAEVGLSWLGYEDVGLQQKYGFDFSFKGKYFSPGRDYSELSNVLGELTYSEEYLRYALQSGLFFQAWDVLLLNLNLNFIYDTSHLLTGEIVGCDGGCPEPGLINRLNALEDSQANKDGQVTLNQSFGERNPYFNPVIDSAGRRLRVEEAFSIELMFKAAVTF